MRRASLGPLVPLVLLIALTAALSACGEDRREIAFGDADRGREMFVSYGCGACHQIGGVRQAVGRVGPQLDGLADQRIIAGSVPNTPEGVAAFIQDPQAYAPATSMPNLGVTPRDAADITAFLLEHR